MKISKVVIIVVVILVMASFGADAVLLHNGLVN